MYRIILLIGLLIGVANVQELQAQSKPQTTRKMKKRTKELQKKKKEQNKEEVDVSEQLRIQHEKNQSKAVRKRMKRNKKRAKRINNNKGEFFLGKWWRKSSIWIKSVFRKKKN